ncbi:hypothetical protein V2J09_009123 [Rumex salicifolius]
MSGTEGKEKPHDSPNLAIASPSSLQWRPNQTRPDPDPAHRPPSEEEATGDGASKTSTRNPPSNPSPPTKPPSPKPSPASETASSTAPPTTTNSSLSLKPVKTTSNGASHEAHNHAGASIALAYAVAGSSALLSVLCYAEFSIDIPVAGGSFSFLRIELGDLVAFLAATNILLEAVVGAAGLEMQLKMAEDVNIAKEVKKSKGEKSKGEGKMASQKSKGKSQISREKVRPLKKQKVGLSVGESSESIPEESSGASPSQRKRLSVTKPRKHGSGALLCSTLKSFNDAQKVVVREMGFGHLFSWNVDALPYILLGNGLLDIPVNDVIVEQYLGLSRGRQQFDTSRVNSMQVKSWRASYPKNKVVNNADVARRLTDNVNTANGSVLSKVLNWFDWDKSDSVKDYNRCRLCRLRLCQMKAKCTNISTFKGPHILLLALYCDKVNLFEDESERKFPIISGYTSKLFKLKQNQHSSCGFDRGYVREALVLATPKPEQTPIIEEEVEGAVEEQEVVRNDDNTFDGVDFGDEVEGGPFYKFIRRQVDLAHIIAEHIRLFYQHIRTTPKEVQDSQTYQKINDVIEKIINFKILCSSQQHQSSQSQDNQDRFFSDPFVIQCIEEIEATFLMSRQEDN